MTLTKQDLQAIQTIVVDTTTPMFEKVFERFDTLETRMDRAESKLTRVEDGLTGVEDRLTVMDKKLDNIDGRLQALEADVKELYLMVAELQKPKPSRRFAKLSAEEKVVAAYNDVLSLAKELGVTLPPR